ncbi:MAG: hypothetical protein MR307_09220 [Megasphaera elsdenii]|nr:hypothetical protein [Megasphaera elsdenii]
MKKMLIAASCLTLLCAGWNLSPVQAEIVTGQAYIENGNLEKANTDARKDAMRTFIESKLGVKVSSTTEVVNSMLVRDSIVTQSDGYVLIKKVIDEKQNGNIYTVSLDLEANTKLIQSAAADLPSRLQALDSDSSRSGINVAIIDEDSRNTALWNDYFTGILKQEGFRAEVNDPVVLYLGQHLGQTDDLTLNTEIRRIGRTGDRMDANAIIRGRISLAQPAEKLAPGSYKAIAQINCELIGYDSNTVDVSSGYYPYVASTAAEAERKAKETALRSAAEELGKQALLTNQQEYRGGVHNLKTTLVFHHLTNKAVQRNQIIAGLRNVNCRVIRSAFTGPDTFQVFVSATDYNNLEELKEAILSHFSAQFPNIIDAVDDNQAGSTKLGFDL